MAGPWHGFWKAENYLYEAEMKLDVGADGSIEGAIDWTLRETSDTSLKDRIGRSGTEHVRGQFLPEPGILTFEGVSKDDPDGILGLDKYRLLLAPNRKSIGGLTDNHGDWRGQFFLELVEKRSVAPARSGGSAEDH